MADVAPSFPHLSRQSPLPSSLPPPLLLIPTVSRRGRSKGRTNFRSTRRDETFRRRINFDNLEIKEASLIAFNRWTDKHILYFLTFQLLSLSPDK